MADLVITAANVVSGTGARIAEGTAGVALTAGQVVYLDSATSTYKLADNDSGTAAARSPKGIALHAAAAGQPIAVHTKGPITIGATVAASGIYVLSSTAGAICPAADLGSGDYTSIIGLGTSTTVIEVNIMEAGVAAA
jgi:hypothetical protein